MKDARLLFIFDNDFGELSWAMSFVHGLALQSRTTFMLPPRLYTVNWQGLPVKTLPYTSYKDLLEAIEVEKPDIVFLFSGYLLPVHQLTSVPVLADLLRVLRNRQCAIVTSDPFWGLMSTNSPLITPETELLLTQASGVLSDVVHLSLAPFSAPGVRSVSFFNSCFAEAKVDPVPAAFWESAGAPDAAARQYWLFALTGLDYDVQATVYGKEGFAGRIVSLFGNTFQAGRYPILLAPDECIFTVEKRSGRTDKAILLPYCSYNLFLPLLINAEYVFSWNVNSTSGHLRMVRGLPTFAFDQGHIARGVRAWYQRVVKYYYNGWVPAQLNQDEALDPGILQRMAVGYAEAAKRILANLATAPQPEELVSSLLRRDDG